MIAIVDYGAGNIFSVQNALKFLEIDCTLTSDPIFIDGADGVILPGVGAFPAAMKKLDEAGLTDTVKRAAAEKPFLGICLGMQMIFSKGYEFEECEGLGLIEGEVRLMEPEGLDIPHMGWNRLIKNNDCPLLSGLGDDEYVYFVHSYAAHCADKDVAAYTDYGSNIPALVHRGNVYGAQFHPEKSGQVGLKMLKNFAALV
ncbi:MAG: imidazole glycerol phosphate synthase subunit HisH [Oscillospiraceae bacterium]|nr:imidazole glycerol phosphate synthase subunit HisH [Oscillospiraceae bacterium]